MEYLDVEGVNGLGAGGEGWAQSGLEVGNEGDITMPGNALTASYPSESTLVPPSSLPTSSPVTSAPSSAVNGFASRLGDTSTPFLSASPNRDNKRSVFQPPIDVDSDGIEITGANIVSPSRPVNHSNGHSRSYIHQNPSSSYPNTTQASRVYDSRPSSSMPDVSANQRNHAGPSRNGNGYAGASAASAIDLTSVKLPSPPPIPDSKRPICIGAVQSRAITLYPSPAIMIGQDPPAGAREKFHLVNFIGAELIKVKLKLRETGAMPRRDEPWCPPSQPVIQVMTPGMSCYIGDLDQVLAERFIPHVRRGILRLEGFAQRLHPEMHQYEVRINVLLFTLPSNIRYLTDDFTATGLYLLDPVPPYDPSRHSDNPPYINCHGSGQVALRLFHAAQARAFGGLPADQSNQVEKARLVEVQRQQVDEVFKSMEGGGDLEQSDPGPYVKTDLFPHQRKALTFLLQKEQDWSSLKSARKYFTKLDEKKRSRKKKAESNAAAETTGSNTPTESEEQNSKDKEDTRSLWEGKKDEKGRVRIWKNKITQEEIRTKKGERPPDSKGAILADDMGLGKTLSIVSLIAATRSAAAKYARTKLEPEEDDEEKPAVAKNGLTASDMSTRIFGMPGPDSDDEIKPSGKGKKRKKEPELPVGGTSAARRARIVKRSRATLLLCPMSTITNWEDQIKEHWNGKVEIVGGAAGIMPPVKKWKPPNKNGNDSDEDEDFDTLKVYIYHGPSRRPDPEFIGSFDIVITSYNTLALEHRKQNSTTGDETPTTPAETATNSDDEIALNGSNGVPPAGRSARPDVDSEIKAAEVADALIKKRTKKAPKPTKATPGAEQTSPLQAIDWFRVVLDEAHYIKTPTTAMSEAACDLVADRKIALTGTPIQNKIDDIWALFKFLRLTPVNDKELFQKWIANPCRLGDTLGVARLRLVMQCCTLRRTKDSKADDGRAILNLPPRREIQHWLDLRDDERKVYDERRMAVQNKVHDLKATGELSKNYAHVLLELLRLRQICDHVELADSGAVEEDYDGTIMDYKVAMSGIEKYGLTQSRALSIVSFLKDGNGALCTACGHDYSDYYPSMDIGMEEVSGVKAEDGKGKKPRLKEKERPLLTRCLHLWCPKCFTKSIYSGSLKRIKDVPKRECTCGAVVQLPKEVIEVIPPEDEKDKDAPPEETAVKRPKRQKYTRPAGEKLNLSTKMQYLHDELLKYSRRNPHSPHYNPFAMTEEDMEEVDSEGRPLVTKSVVFSQWTTMLDRIGDMLDEVKIKYARLDGTMTREERAKAMDELRYNKHVEILLVSTRAGGVGLNLTAASRAYLVDPYWNPSVEAQAIDRIHRMGQTRPVYAIKLMINDSVEQKLALMQEKKASLARLSLNSMTKEEIMAQKAEELANLFS